LTSHFANGWQFFADFAKVWQNVSRTRRMVLPMFGKFGPFLPNIGKPENREAQAAISPCMRTAASIKSAPVRGKRARGGIPPPPKQESIP
jgi:hypothetical protein